MSFLENAKRAISGRDADYDDDREYDEEYDEYEEEKPRRSLFSFLSKNKREEYDDYAEEEAAAEARSSMRDSSSYQQRRTSDRYSGDRYNTRNTAKRVPDLTGVEVTVLYPNSFDDSVKLVKEVKDGRITLFDVSGIDSPEEARRVVDYICGAAEGMECPFSRLCPSIFCIAPKGVVLNNRKNRY